MVVNRPPTPPAHSRAINGAKRTSPASRRPAEKRRRQLLKIAFDHIAERGLEGLRFQEVASAAGINNASLLYYFSSKEALIQGVVSNLVDQMRGQPVQPAEQPSGAVEALRREFDGVRKLLVRSPKFFIVLTEFALRAKRDPVIARVTRSRDDFWRTNLTSILERGIKEGAFRSSIRVDTAVTALMAQIKGIAYHATMLKRKPGEIASLLSEVEGQVEHWLTCGA